MKKLLLVLLVCLGAQQVHAQDPDLFQTWYLHSISYENGDFINVAGFDPPINPTLEITPSFEFSGQGACNTFEGTFTFFEPMDLEVATFSNTTTSCGFSLDQFEDAYFGFFAPTIYIVTFINDDGNNERTLFMIGGIFTELTFRNVPVLSNPEFDARTFSVYPNPCNDILYFDLASLTIEKINVFSVSGQQVLSEKSNFDKMDVSSLDAGLYFAEVSTSEGKRIARFIKE